MIRILSFLLDTLFFVLIGAALLRGWMNAWRITLRGPLGQAVMALTDCDFVAIDQKRFVYLVRQAPHFAMQVMRVMAERLRHANQLLKELEKA